MTLVIFIITLAVIEYLVFSLLAGLARDKFNIKAPAVTGHPEFERRLRVQHNTLEQLIAFIPAILAFSWMAESIGWAGDEIASGLGVIWLIGRLLYATSYVRDPASRAMGFLLTLLPTFILLLGTLVAILVSLL
ncbi:MAG: MAPEG family protein [Pseudohongiellaceae bacterium]